MILYIYMIWNYGNYIYGMKWNEIIWYDMIWHGLCSFFPATICQGIPRFAKTPSRLPAFLWSSWPQQGEKYGEDMVMKGWKDDERMEDYDAYGRDLRWETLRCLRLWAIWGEGNGLFRSNMIPVNSTMLSSKLFHVSCWRLYGLAASKSPCTTDWWSLAWRSWKSQSQGETDEYARKDSTEKNLATTVNCICAFQALGSCMLENRWRCRLKRRQQYRKHIAHLKGTSKNDAWWQWAGCRSQQPWSTLVIITTVH